MAKKRSRTNLVPAESDDTYALILAGVTELLESARRAATRSVNSLMTAAYWEIGRRFVEEDQRGHARVAYGERLIERLSLDLMTRFGRGFSSVNFKQMRKFYPEWLPAKIGQMPSDQLSAGAQFLKGIRHGLEDVRAGRTQPLAEAFAHIRRDLNLPQGS
jgi:hypothetical protein